MSVKDIVFRRVIIHASLHVTIIALISVKQHAVLDAKMGARWDVLDVNTHVLILQRIELLIRAVLDVVLQMDVCLHVNLIAITIVLVEDVNLYVELIMREHVMLTVE